MRWFQTVLLVSLLSVLCSCTMYGRLKRALVAEERIAREITEFYENAAESYDFIGWSYFNLAIETRNAGNEELSQEFAQKAQVYARFAKQWREKAKDRRETLKILEGKE